MRKPYFIWWLSSEATLMIGTDDSDSDGDEPITFERAVALVTFNLADLGPAARQKLQEHINVAHQARATRADH